MSIENPLLQRALTAHQNQQLEAARAAYTAYLRTHEDDVQAWYLLSKVEIQAENMTIAKSHIEKAMRLNPESAQYCLALAEIYEKTENHDLAVEAYAKALQLRPDVYLVHYEVGCYHLNQKHWDKALNAFEQSVQLKPDHISSLANLAQIYQLQKNYPKANVYALKAVKLAPKDPRLMNNYATLMSAQKRYQESWDYAQKALEITPNYLAAKITLASSCFALSKKGDAENICQEILERDKDNIEAQSLLAKCLIDREQMSLAEEILIKAYQVNSQHLGICMYLAELFVHKNQLQEAIEVLNDAIKIHPESILLKQSLALVYTKFGQIEPAIKIYQQILAQDTEQTEVIFSWANLQKVTTQDNAQIAQFEALFNSKKLTDPEQSNLGFALGKIYDDLKIPEKSFEFYQKANQLRYDANDSSQNTLLIDKTMQYFTKEAVLAIDDFEQISFVPVFIVGMPRSGSTLLEQVLASHSQIEGAGELSEIQNIVKNIKKIDLNGADYIDNLNLLSKNELRLFRERYILKLNELKITSHYIVDKNPINFLHIGLIKMIFPEAKFIHIERNPLDVLLSNYFQRFIHGQNFSFNLDAICSYYKDYFKMMSFWNDIYPKEISNCTYDDLVKRFKKTIKHNLHFLGLKWEVSCGKFYQQQRKVETASLWQIRQPIYKGSLKRWKNYEPYLAQYKKTLDEEVKSYEKRINHQSILGLF